MPDPRTVFARLREQLFRYYGTPYRLRVPEVEDERLTLLDRDGATWREPWIEAIADYEPTGQRFGPALDAIEAPSRTGDFRQLWAHRVRRYLQASTRRSPRLPRGFQRRDHGRHGLGQDRVLPSARREAP